MVSFLASGAKITINGLPMFVSISETVSVPVAIGFVLNHALGKNETFKEVQKVMPGVAVLGLACVCLLYTSIPCICKRTYRIISIKKEVAYERMERIFN